MFPQKQNQNTYNHMNTYPYGSVYSQFDGFVPHDGITGQCKCLDVHDVYVAMVCAYVHPFRLERQVAERHPTQTSKLIKYTSLYVHFPLTILSYYRRESITWGCFKLYIREKNSQRLKINGNPLQSYGASPAVWVLPATLNVPGLNPRQASQ